MKAQGQMAQGNSEGDIYAGVYRTLVLGMTIASFFLAIGVFLALAHHGSASLVLKAPHAYSLNAIFTGLLHADPISFLALGTIITILTPISRVVVSIAIFLYDRDYAFAWITLLVFFTAILSMTLGLFGLHG